jgi:DNA-binding transcriptional LysR family regulator
MTPTPRAQALRLSLEDALASVARVVTPRADLATLSQTIHLALVDYGIALFGPPLVAALRTSAPGIDLVVAPWTGADDDFARVTDGSLDLVVGVLAPGAAALRWEPLFSERYVVAMRRSHPARKRFSLQEWIRHPHVVVSGRGQTSGALDAVLATRGKTRRVGMVVPSFLAVPAIVANSDYLALIPERLLAAGRYEGVVAREPPVAVPSFEVGIAWHPRRDHDAATMHVARLLRENGRAAGSSARRLGTRRPSRPTPRADP